MAGTKDHRQPRSDAGDYEFGTVCPFCTRQNPLVTNLRGNEWPQNNDFNMCFGCGKWSVFDNTRKNGLREPNPSELHVIAHDPDCQKFTMAWIIYS